MSAVNLAQVAKVLRSTAANLVNQCQGINPATAAVLRAEAKTLTDQANLLDPPVASAKG